MRDIDDVRAACESLRVQRCGIESVDRHNPAIDLATEQMILAAAAGDRAASNRYRRQRDRAFAKLYLAIARAAMEQRDVDTASAALTKVEEALEGRPRRRH